MMTGSLFICEYECLIGVCVQDEGWTYMCAYMEARGGGHVKFLSIGLFC